MTTGCKTTTVFLTILCGLLLTILGLTQEWPLWAWPTLALLLVAIPAVAFRIATLRRGSMPVDFEEQLTAAPVERREHHISHVALPSLWADYDFLVSATIRWYPLDASADGPLLNPAGLAVEAVLDRARAVTEQREPARASLVQHELCGELSLMRPDRAGRLQAMAENVTLTLHEHDQERLDKLAGVRKDKAVWEHRRTYEQSKREYLGDDVLKDTGSAVVWWLAKNDDHVEKTVADLGLLAALTSAANDTDVPERLRDLLPQPREEQAGHDLWERQNASHERPPTAADHLVDALYALGFPDGDPRRPMIAKQVADVLRTQDQHETADGLLRRFNPPATYTPDGKEPPAPTDRETGTTPEA
ncbi:hypothetical protein [Streptomyces salyersiae]|uniref:Uncharacterized protein n=1 Tax=Streptomyces salyersiae TaxID=3075530 RepID=A0ABU2RMA7_9ACTN|nr:hypothetical protein [Streptomyces sp. DSM 41770]MDT0429647.1 hypothetical protein [Streptomyces sp. DSM 41770]